MSKSIVICCDGTGNEYGLRNSNVVKLFRLLVRNSVDQLAYYDPGVGTLSAPGILSTPVKKLTKLMGKGFGLGLTANIEDAYRYLMDTYQPGDKVFLFGFSRGAYTVRALAGMLHKCGLLEKGSENLVSYASKIFKYEKRTSVYQGFKETYSRSCPVHFLGIWDTVSSVGYIYNPMVLWFTATNPSVAIVRHAVSIDERRCYFRQNLWKQSSPEQDVKQVWFAGVHSDVGGSYPEMESGLSKIALQWIVQEAVDANLLVDSGQLRKVIPEKPLALFSRKDTDVPYSQHQHQVDSHLDQYAPPDHTAKMHNSLKWYWWIVELIPKIYTTMSTNPPSKKIKWPLGRPRRIPEGSIIHASVFKRIKDVPDYHPGNLPEVYQIEKETSRSSQPVS